MAKNYRESSSDFSGNYYRFIREARYEEALQLIDSEVNIKPNNPKLCELKCWTLNYNNQYEEAIETCEKAIKNGTATETVWDAKECAKNLIQYEEVLESYNRLIEIDPKNVNAWHNKGIVLDYLGRFEEAIEAYNQAIEIDPMDPITWNNKGCTLENLGCFKGAIEAYDQAIKIDPKCGVAWHNKGLLMEEFFECSEEANEAYDQAEEIAWRWYINATTLYKSGSYKEAIEAYDQAIDIDPMDFIAWNNKGNALVKLGFYKEAIKAYNRAIEIDPNFISAQDNKRNTLKKIGLYDEDI